VPEVSTKPVAEKPLAQLELPRLLARLEQREWDKQVAVIAELSRREQKQSTQVRNFLLDAVQQKKQHLRVRLLAAQVLARFGDLRALPILLKLAERLYDQPTPLLSGVLLTYGQKAVPALLKAVNHSRYPHISLQVLGWLRVPDALPQIEVHLMASQQQLRQIALEALLQYPKQTILAMIGRIFQRESDVDLRSSLVRIIAHLDAAEAVALLVGRMRDPHDSIRFLSRLSLEDKAGKLHRDGANKISAPPKDKESREPLEWERWWQHNKKAVHNFYRQHHAQTVLQQMPQGNRQEVLLLYSTIHPLFSYGRMPILIHDARWQDPPSPIEGKVWRVALPPEKFEDLLERLDHSGFFNWPQDLGHIRDLTVYEGQNYRKVSLGMLRYLAFELIEQEIVTASSKAGLNLQYNDFYYRLDESDLVGEGQIGQWAYRKADLLHLRPWTPRKQWKPLADLEGLWATMRDVLNFLPSRTRLIYIDTVGQRMRFGALLYGSRAQSRYTLEGLSRSRRLSKFNLQGISMIYLVRDKVEQMIFDFVRYSLPHGSRSNRRMQASEIPLLDALVEVWRDPDVQLQDLRIQQGRPHRLVVRFKARDTYALLQCLARLALQSSGDRVLAFRINHSGLPDRDKYRLIVQLQWEMLSTIALPKQVPYSFQLLPKAAQDIFQPVYR
jgi:hypothetical protein